MYAEYLRLSACDVAEAEDGREALAKAIAHGPDIIVTETRLPGISGFALCDLLRHDAATRAIPIIVVTGDAFDADVKRAREAGADLVLVKPCLPETLLVEIRRLLKQSAELRDRARLIRDRVGGQLTRSNRLLAKAERTKRQVLSHVHARHDTSTPPAPPPSLLCPTCDQGLRYVHSHIGGVSERHAEQWDYFECPAGCGTFQYRQRTRKLRWMM